MNEPRDTEFRESPNFIRISQLLVIIIVNKQTNTNQTSIKISQCLLTRLYIFDDKFNDYLDVTPRCLAKRALEIKIVFFARQINRIIWRENLYLNSPRQVRQTCVYTAILMMKIMKSFSSVRLTNYRIPKSSSDWGRKFSEMRYLMIMRTILSHAYTNIKIIKALLQRVYMCQS